MHSECQKLHLQIQPVSSLSESFLSLRPYFLFDMDHKVGLKSPGKTGCTSWKVALLNNTGKINLDDIQKIEGGEKLHWVHVIAARETGPLLSSKYRPAKEVREAIKRSYIILTVRHPFSRLESAYTDKVIVQDKIRGKILKRRTGISKTELKRLSQNGKNIPFAEFLEYSLTEPNEHWSPIFELTAPCTVPYQ